MDFLLDDFQIPQVRWVGRLLMPGTNSLPSFPYIGNEAAKTTQTFEKGGYMRHRWYRLFLLPVLFAIASVAVLAQQNSEIVGTVSDQTGAAVPGANLTL